MIEKLIQYVVGTLIITGIPASILAMTTKLFAKLEKRKVEESRIRNVTIVACFIGNFFVLVAIALPPGLLGKFVAVLATHFVVAVIAAKLIFSPPISTRVFIGIVYSALITILTFGLFALVFAL